MSSNMQLLAIIVTIGLALLLFLANMWWKIAQLEKSQQHFEEDLKVLKADFKDIQTTLIKLDTHVNYKTQQEKK